MKLNKVLFAGLVGAAIFTAACSDDDDSPSNTKQVYDQVSGLCTAVTTVNTCNTNGKPVDCLAAAKALSDYATANGEELKAAFTDWKGFELSDIIYGLAASTNLYALKNAISNCDDGGIEENKTNALNALNGLTTVEGWGAALNAAAASQNDQSSTSN